MNPLSFSEMVGSTTRGRLSDGLSVTAVTPSPSTTIEEHRDEPESD